MTQMTGQKSFGRSGMMSRYIDADDVANAIYHHFPSIRTMADARGIIEEAPSIDIVRCANCRKSHIDGKTTHYLWCTEWGRSTDPFGYCERGEREGE